MRRAGPRTAVVTGASSGIGRALAVRMAREGWRVTGTARDVEAARAADWPSGVDIAALDLRRPESITGFVDGLTGQRAPDALVNNAGALEFKAIEDYGQAEAESLFHVNVLGPMRLTTALVPAFRARGSGVILNVSSLSGIMLFPFYGMYGGTKHALEALSETLWYELRPFGVRVKLVQPGFVDSPIWDKAGADLAAIDPSSPYGRLQARMVRLEQRTGRREPCEKAADLIWRALNDESWRFRYPICGARPFALARRLLGPDLQMRVLWNMWMRS
jgi:short-subunit dehydrogenase